MCLVSKRAEHPAGSIRARRRERTHTIRTNSTRNPVAPIFISDTLNSGSPTGFRMYLCGREYLEKKCGFRRYFFEFYAFKRERKTNLNLVLPLTLQFLSLKPESFHLLCKPVKCLIAMTATVYNSLLLFVYYSFQ